MINSLFNSTVFFIAKKLLFVLIFKLTLDTFFANAKAMKAFIDMNLKLMVKMVDKRNSRT